MITPIIVLCLLISPSLVMAARAYLRRQAYTLSDHAYLGLALAFVFFASGRVFVPMQLVNMLPPWLPLRLELVYLSGFLELGVAVALMFSQCRRYAAIIAVAIFVGFFPINIYSAFQYSGTAGQQMGPIYLWIRTPLQLLLVCWTYFLVVKPNRDKRLSTVKPL